MKRFTLMACAGLLAAAMAVPSLAADLPRPVYKAPPVFVAPFSWSGFYVGINGGYGWGNATVSNTLGSFTTNGTDGGLVGATLGYNLQTGNWVWGVEADIDYAFIKGNVSNTVAGCAGCKVENTWLGTARGRIGYAFDRWLPYITGGAAFGGVKVATPLGSNTDTASLAGRLAPASNTPSSAPGRPSWNISTPILARRLAPPQLAASRPTSNPRSTWSASV